MKKFVSVLSIIFCFLFVMAFAGCTEKKESDKGEGSKKETNVVLTDVLAEINNEFSISENDMMPIETTGDLELFYNILSTDVKQFAAETTVNTATDIAEIILVEAVDSDAAGRVYDALLHRYSSQRDLCASYSAELLAIIDKCSVERSGNMVTLIMSSDAKEITEFYNSLV